MRILTLDVGGTAIKSALMEEQGALIEERESPSGADIEAMVRAMIRVARSYGDYAAVGVSMTGQVDGRTGRVAFCSEGEAGAGGTPVAQRLQEQLHCPVVVENDANAAALGEARFGAGRGVRDFLCVTLGTGIGGGLILDGKLYAGVHGIAGEIGHMPIHAGGELCRCGLRGCYEHYASTTALVRAAHAVDPALENGREVFERREKDAQLQAAIDRWIGEIAYGLVVLTHTLNPERIALGGGVMGQAYILEQLRALVPLQLMPNFRSVELVRAQLGYRAGMYGAYALALEALQAEHN
ncbi:MAG TPA: ROK family protein [Clostridia bacterium]|nr:ROK family protein [Clostridia bacterium]